MSTTPHMSPMQQQGQQYGPQQQFSPGQGQQQGQQQGPSTAPPQQSGQQQQYQQQPFGQQPYGQRQFAPQGMRGVQGTQGMQGMQGMQGAQGMQQPVPPHLQQQLQQLGQQQPYQQLLQQLGQESVPQAQAPEISTQAVSSGIAVSFWDVIQPLPGQSVVLYLLIDNTWKAFINPSQQTHDAVQEAFAYGQQVIGYYDTTNPSYLVAIVITPK
ncbi:hypothetical protein OG302_33070 [Streptomyces sp. NBC_01283]|uniref:hypothetical protein n=1 Tax=Streptomyces sp. NBC_01283 TaxID=2903812 RepID=UPI00352E13C4|nr:hypothetical protein OG302_33070 [Streptomyces sp. NBC_01283]